MGDTELELAQLLCTRLCHDLAGPVGAVAAGVELIGGDPGQVDAETLGLIGNSSVAASLKLKFMRAALGPPGGTSGDPRALLEGYLKAVSGQGGVPAVTWPAPASLALGESVVGAGWTQTVLNLCLLGFETLPGCRTLALQLVDASDLNVTVETRGAPDRAVILRDELLAAVAGRTPPALSAKTIHSHVAGRLVRAAGGSLGLSASGNRVTVTAVFPRAEGILKNRLPHS